MCPLQPSLHKNRPIFAPSLSDDWFIRSSAVGDREFRDAQAVPRAFGKHICFDFKAARFELQAPDCVAAVRPEPRAHVADARTKQRPREEREGVFPTTTDLLPVAQFSSVKLLNLPKAT